MQLTEDGRKLKVNSIAERISNKCELPDDNVYVT
jgi:hypothetical protein